MISEIQKTPLYLTAKDFHDTYCPNCPDHRCNLGDALADIHRNTMHEAKLETSEVFCLKEPEPEAFIGTGHSRYKGRDFYGDHADTMAELYYLRDWKLWVEQRFRGFRTVASFLKNLSEP